MVKAVSLLLLLLLCPAPARAEGGSPAPAAGPGPGEVVEGDWLVDRLSAEPATLNPITATDAYATDVNAWVYETLLERDRDTLQLKGLLAESWQVSPDHLTYTFTLRPGVRFHDGTPLTARDVKFTYDKARDPKVDAPHLQNYYQDLVRVEAVSDREVRFTCARPYYKMLDMLGGLEILPAHLWEQGDFNSHPAGRAPVGSGPYRFLRWDTGKEVVLERNPDYWGRKPAFRRMVFKVVTDENSALQLLKRHDLDLMALTPVQWVKQTGTAAFGEEFTKLQYFLPGYSYIGWNSRRAVFSDPRVRRALTQLLDRETILKTLRFGFGKVVSGPMFYETAEYDRAIEPWPYDRQAAAALLDEAGWRKGKDGLRAKEGKPFRFEFTYTSGSTFAEQLGTVLKESLRKEGIEVSLRPLEWATFIKGLDERAFDAAVLSWSLPVEQDPYQVWHSSQVKAGSNFVGFADPEADRLIEQARTEFDREKRIALYRRFHRIVHQQQPYTFLFMSESLVAVDKRFAGVKVHKLGLDSREWWVPLERQKYR